MDSSGQLGTMIDPLTKKSNSETSIQSDPFRSTIPSADVLANPRREPLRKVLWCLVLAPLIYFTITDLTDVIRGYMQYPVRGDGQ